MNPADCRSVVPGVNSSGGHTSAPAPRRVHRRSRRRQAGSRGVRTVLLSAIDRLQRSSMQHRPPCRDCVVRSVHEHVAPFEARCPQLRAGYLRQYPSRAE